MPSSRASHNQGPPAPEARPAPSGRRWRAVGLALGLAWLLYGWGAWPLAWHLALKPSLDPARPGLTALVSSPLADGGRVRASLKLPSSEGHLRDPHSSLRAYGIWLVPADGEYLLRLSCDDEGSLKMDGKTLIRLAGVNANNVGEDRVRLAAGPHLLEVELANLLGQGWFKVQVQGPGGEALELLGPESLRQLDLGNFDFWARMVSGARAVTGLGLGGPALLLLFLGLNCLGLTRAPALWACVAVVLAGAAADIHLQRGQQLTRLARQGSNVLEVMFELERYLQSPGHQEAKGRLPGMFMVGDSSHTFYPGMPDSMLNITREVAREQGRGGRAEIYGAAQPGFHVYDFYLLMNRVAPEKPRLVVMPVNVRTFGKISQMHWFEDLYGYLLWSELVNPSGLSSSVRPLPWGRLLTAKLESCVMKDTGLPFLLVASHLWRNLQDGWEKDFKKWAAGEFGLERWAAPPQERGKKLGAEWVDIEPGHHLFPVYQRINRLARARGVTVLYYAVPLNLAGAGLPPAYMRESYAAIREQLADPPYAHFLDLSTMDMHNQFADALEHFTPEGKRDLARALLDAAWPILEK